MTLFNYLNRKSQLIKFTFDVNSIKEDDKNKYEIFQCNPGNDFIYQNQLNNNNILTSIYNSFPIIFENGIINFKSDDIISEINNYYKDELIRLKDNSYDTFLYNIKNKKSIKLTYQCYNNQKHSISLIGMAKNKIYYIDSKEELLFKSLVSYIKDKLNIKDSSYEEIFELIAQLVGYAYYENTKISCIKSCYLTNKSIFYDVKSMIEQVSNKVFLRKYEDDCSCCMCGNFDFSRLFKIFIFTQHMGYYFSKSIKFNKYLNGELENDKKL